MPDIQEIYFSFLYSSSRILSNITKVFSCSFHFYMQCSTYKVTFALFYTELAGFCAGVSVCGLVLLFFKTSGQLGAFALQTSVI